MSAHGAELCDPQCHRIARFCGVVAVCFVVPPIVLFQVVGQLVPSDGFWLLFFPVYFSVTVAAFGCGAVHRKQTAALATAAAVLCVLAALWRVQRFLLPSRTCWAYSIFLAGLVVLAVLAIGLALGGYFLGGRFGKRRDDRGAARRCRVCEYDLTGNQSGVCPECGSALSRAEGRS